MTVLQVDVETSDVGTFGAGIISQCRKEKIWSVRLEGNGLRSKKKLQHLISSLFATKPPLIRQICLLAERNRDSHPATVAKSVQGPTPAKCRLLE